MNLTFACPHCETTSRVPLPSESSALVCPACGWRREIAWDVRPDQKPDECLVCGCRELFIRKDFSQRLGVAIVVLGFAASTVAWFYHMRYTTYGILFATAFIDVVLYAEVGTLLQCYRCPAEYRGLPGLYEHAAFNLETHERYRQQAIRLAESHASQNKSGTVGRPAPALSGESHASQNKGA